MNKPFKHNLSAYYVKSMRAYHKGTNKPYHIRQMVKAENYISSPYAMTKIHVTAYKDSGLVVLVNASNTMRFLHFDSLYATNNFVESCKDKWDIKLLDTFSHAGFTDLYYEIRGL